MVLRYNTTYISITGRSPGPHNHTHCNPSLEYRYQSYPCEITCISDIAPYPGYIVLGRVFFYSHSFIQSTLIHL
nr:MAG TPA: hypothetical protein [Bacteriophage sp.]